MNTKLLLLTLVTLFAGNASASSPKSTPVKDPSYANAKAGVTFYEGFEGWEESNGINWIPEGWTKICTDAHKPKPESLARNVNNTWYVYPSSDFFQEMTPDGECEAFIHFGFSDDERGSSNAAQDEWLITPEMTLGENEELSFYLQCDYHTLYPWDWDKNWLGDRSIVENNLLVMITTDNGENWEEAWNLEADEARKETDADCIFKYGSMQYHQYSFSLAGYAGKTIKIGFRYVRHAGDGKGNSMMLDGVTVKPAGFIFDPNEPSRDGWSLLGTGSMADGWVLPALTVTPGEFYNPQDYIFPVNIYEKDGEPGMFLLASPWTSDQFPFIYFNGNKTKHHDIIIDATDPDFVIVSPQETGFEHNNPGNKNKRYSTPYIISHAGKRFLDEGNTKHDIISYGHNATYDPDKGIITIPGPEYGHKTSDMGYAPSDFNAYPSVIYLPTGTDPEPVWNPLGEATFVDGFLFPGFVGDPEGNEWKVAIEEKAGQPGMYRIINPYTTPLSPLTTYNSNTRSAKIIIDATDPELVVMEPQYSGFSGYVDGTPWNYYIGNDVGVLIFSGGQLKEQLKDLLSDARKDTLVDGVITFKDALFGNNNYGGFGYHWTDDNGKNVKYTAKLFLPTSGIGSILGDDDAPVEWYTTSGIRLHSEPTSPGLYIRLQGSHAQKILK